jgi:hypothetical protein
MKGWKYDNYRHSLAARGISTSRFNAVVGPIRGKKPAFVMLDESQIYKQLENELRNRDADMEAISMYDVAKKNNKILGIKEKPEFLWIVGDKTFEPIPVKEDLQNILVKKQVDEALMRELAEERAIIEDAEKHIGEIQELEKIKENLEELEPERDEFIDMIDRRKKADERFFRMSAKETPGQYIKHELASHQHGDKLNNFKSSVGQLFSHPLGAADREWLSDERAAGHRSHLSKDPINRAEERAAAVTGVVITEGNVQPMLDYEKNKNTRESAVDILFGR